MMNHLLEDMGNLADDMGFLPLPAEVYPRVLDRPKHNRAYYLALSLVMGVWLIMPVCCVYLGWYAIYSPRVSVTGAILAAYALTEVVFALYQQYLIRFAQTPAPPSQLPLEQRHQLFLRVLTSGLGYPEPTRPERREDELDVEFEAKEEVYRRYLSGQISAAKYHRLLDGHYQEGLGMQEESDTACMGQREMDLIDAFVEDVPGDREARLRREVEGDWTEDDQGDEEEDEAIVDRDGKVKRLQFWDQRAIEFRERLRTWFDHAPWASLRKDNILTWLAWSSFNLPLAAALADPELEAFLCRSYEVLEARTGTTFPPGHEPSIRTIRLTLDPIIARARPLFLYALTALINWFLTSVYLYFRGMSLHVEGDVEYLVRIPKGWTADKGRTDPSAMPIVFLHGLGFGMLQNVLVVNDMLGKLSTHPVVLPIAHHTAQNIFHPQHLRPWTKEQFVRDMQGICRKWGFWEDPQVGLEGRGDLWGGVSLMSHSNGSVGHAWLLSGCPSLIRRSAFVDPVVFCLWEGDVCHSFCYRSPRAALELLLYYFISTEVGISNYIQRHFDWADNTLFLDGPEFPLRRRKSGSSTNHPSTPSGAHLIDPDACRIFLGGKDIIVDAGRVRRYLERHGVRVGEGLQWADDAGHGDGLNGEIKDRVLRFVGGGSAQEYDLRVEKMKGQRGANETGSDQVTLAGSGEDSDRTFVEESRKEK